MILTGILRNKIIELWNTAIWDEVVLEFQDEITILNSTQNIQLLILGLTNKGLEVEKVSSLEAAFDVSSPNKLQQLVMIKLGAFVPMALLQGLDYTLFSLVKQTPKFSSKGRKYKSNYTTDIEGLDLVVIKEFEDIVLPDGRHAYTITHSFLHNNGSTDYLKIETKPFSKAEWALIHWNRRHLTTTYLQELAIGTPIEAQILPIFTHYKEQIQMYVETGSIEFENAINNEVDTTILGYLNTITGFYADGVTPINAKQAILLRISDTSSEITYG